jgi:hypothetical protein
MHIELYNADYLNFVELNLTGDNDNYNRCDVESKYLDSPLFYIFQPSFEEANKMFDYFAGTKYNSRKIIVLRNNLIANLKELEALSSLTGFINLISSRFMGKEFISELDNEDNLWRLHWKEFNGQIIGVNKDLIDLVEKCAFDERVLWVIGY